MNTFLIFKLHNCTIAQLHELSLRHPAFLTGYGSTYGESTRGQSTRGQECCALKIEATRIGDF